MRILNLILTKKKILIAIWGIASIYMLYIGVECSINKDPYFNDCAVVSGLFTIILNGGAPFVFLYLLDVIRYLLPLDMNENYLLLLSYTVTPIVFWSVSTFLGYIQWFMLVPYLWKKLCKLLLRLRK